MRMGDPVRIRSIVTALLLAGAAAIPLSGISAAATSTSDGYPGYGCRDGAMWAAGQGFYTCVNGQFVYRECGPGTHAEQQGADYVICNYD
ncbi:MULTISPECIES: hypothetical protein [Streptomyces]|uniref:hypothetical protein n=1 Tax=Streptomyces TaxID=1883 RepID=UPI00131D9514|nr:hypothetical protein [Streptomyces olivochromogenes]